YMKKLLILLFVINSIVLAQLDKFIIGAEHVSSFHDFGGSTLPHSSEFWDTVKSFGINFAGLKYFQTPPGSSNTGFVSVGDITSDLSEAHGRNIDVYLDNGFNRNPATYDPYFQKRWVYQIEYIPSNSLNDFQNVPKGLPLIDPDGLVHWNIFQPGIQSINYLKFDPSQTGYGLVAYNLREKNLQPDFLVYYLKVRVRLPSAANFPLPNIPILTFTVKKPGGGSLSGTVSADKIPDNDWHEILVMAYHKLPSGPSNVIPYVEDSTVYNFTDPFSTVQLRNYSVKPTVTFTDYDIEVELNDTDPYNYVVDLDYVAIDDANSQSLYTNVLNPRIQDFAVNYKDNAAVKNFMTWDEALTENNFPVSKIGSTLKNFGIGVKNPISYFYFNDNPQQTVMRYLYETNSDVLLSDIYPIPYLDSNGNLFATPGQTGYTSILQNRIQSHYVSHLRKLISNSVLFNKPLWLTVQAHKWAVDYPDPYKDDELFCREPSAYEIKAMANLGVCYGAKSINYYIYSNNSDDLTDNRIGIMEQNDPPIPRFTDAYGYPKWTTVQQLNNKLASIGNELIQLTWQNAFSIHQGQPSGIYINSVTTTDAANQTYVELGIFKKTDELTNPNLEYFFVVNRRTMPTEQRNITVTINKSNSIFNNWKVVEAGTLNEWVIGKTSSFETTFEPGEGKLFRLEPVMIAGGSLITNETLPANTTLDIKGSINIPAGKTLTINSGCTLNFPNRTALTVSGNLSINGSVNSKVHFDFEVGTLYGSESTPPEGIKIYGSPAVNIQYAVIKNAPHSKFKGYGFGRDNVPKTFG
ncbi:MAG: hypothetical protein K8H86_11630, partial [Ignavibacteriaceae bacterium]|nr:hypothetical protein [Ignavibacteriaceae bacterium]